MLAGISLVIGFSLVVLTRDTGSFDMVVILMAMLFTAGYLFDVIRAKQYRDYRVILIIGYLLRLALLFYDVYSSDPLRLPLVGGQMTTDPFLFYRSAVRYSQGARDSYGGYFSIIMGMLFSVAAPSRFLGEFFVMLLSIATLHIFTKTLDLMDLPKKSRQRAALLVCVLPNFAFLSVIFRRESFIWLFVAASLYFFVKWMTGKARPSAFILAIGLALLASLFHGATGLMAAGYLLIRLIYSPQKQKITLEVRNIAAFAALSVIFLFVYARWGSVFFGKLERLTGSISSLSSTREAGGSSYARYVGDSRSIPRILIFFIPRFVYFMFSPFPWDWRSVNDLITFLMSSSVYLYILVSALRYIRRHPSDDPRRRYLIILLVIAVLMDVIFSWGTTNTGTATRHRDKFLVLYGLIFALSRGEHGRLRFRQRLKF